MYLFRAPLLAVQCLLGKLALKCDRDQLTGINHALMIVSIITLSTTCSYTGESPFTSVLALDGDKLHDLVPALVHENLPVCIALPGCHNRIGGVVGAESSKASTASHAGATMRIAGTACCVKLVLALETHAIHFRRELIELDVAESK